MKHCKNINKGPCCQRRDMFCRWRVRQRTGRDGRATNTEEKTQKQTQNKHTKTQKRMESPVPACSGYTGNCTPGLTLPHSAKLSENGAKTQRNKTKAKQTKTKTKQRQRTQKGHGWGPETLYSIWNVLQGCACSTNAYLRSKGTCSALRSGYGPHSAGRATLNISY